MYVEITKQKIWLRNVMTALKMVKDVILIAKVMLLDGIVLF